MMDPAQPVRGSLVLPSVRIRISHLGVQSELWQHVAVYRGYRGFQDEDELDVENRQVFADFEL